MKYLLPILALLLFDSSPSAPPLGSPALEAYMDAKINDPANVLEPHGSNPWHDWDVLSFWQDRISEAAIPINADPVCVDYYQKRLLYDLIDWLYFADSWWWFYHEYNPWSPDTVRLLGRHFEAHPVIPAVYLLDGTPWSQEPNPALKRGERSVETTVSFARGYRDLVWVGLGDPEVNASPLQGAYEPPESAYYWKGRWDYAWGRYMEGLSSCY